MKILIKIINLILRYSIGKEIRYSNRSIVTGRYCKRPTQQTTPRYIKCHTWQDDATFYLRMN